MQIISISSNISAFWMTWKDSQFGINQTAFLKMWTIPSTPIPLLSLPLAFLSPLHLYLSTVSIFFTHSKSPVSVSVCVRWSRGVVTSHSCSSSPGGWGARGVGGGVLCSGHSVHTDHITTQEICSAPAHTHTLFITGPYVFSLINSHPFSSIAIVFFCLEFNSFKAPFTLPIILNFTDPKINCLTSRPQWGF